MEVIFQSLSAALLGIVALAWIGFLFVASLKSTNRRQSCLGAVVVTYESPLSVQATTVGPTTAQIGNRINYVSATIVASADGDTAATVTHNLGSNAAELALGHPWVILEPLLSQALTALSSWIIATKTAIVITLTKLASTGSGNASAQLRTVIIRPPTLIR